MNKNKVKRHILYNLSKETVLHIKDILYKFNQSKDIVFKSTLANEIMQLTNVDFGTCRICGQPIIYNHTDVIFREDRNLTTNDNKVYWSAINHPAEYVRILENKEYHLSCCEQCLRNVFKDNFPKTNTLIFSKGQRWSAFVYNVPDDVAKCTRQNTVGVTETAMIRKWGEVEGKKHWKHYCDLQSKTNTFEYKQEKYGWSKEKFDTYNKSRSITLENLILKYGNDEGHEKWNKYIEKQHTTKSWEYMVDKFGEEKATEINKAKALTLNNFIKKYGDNNIARQKYYNAIKFCKTFYSVSSQQFFDEIDEYISKKYKTYYATKTGEYPVVLNDGTSIRLDYYIKELNLCIEFNGDIFHGNPQKYKATDRPNPWHKEITAQQIWNNDKKRYKLLNETLGTKVIVVWESDYNKGINIEDFIENTLGINLY